MPLPESIRRLIDSGRRRLTVMWLLSALVVAVAFAGAVAALLLGVSRVIVVLWAEPVAWALFAVAAGMALIVTAIRVPSRRRAAFEIDRRLNGFDRVTTALELTSRGSELSEPEQRAIRSAAAWASERRTDGLGSLVPKRPLPHLAILTLAATLVLSVVPSITDAAAAEIEANRQRIAIEADEVDEFAEDAPEEIAAQLEALAEELRAAASIPEALELLGEAREELLGALDPGDLAMRTALSGLEKSLAGDPLAEGADAARQLESLAAELNDLSAEELLDAADELAQRAEDFAGVDDELSAALQVAADGMLRMVANDENARDAVADALGEASEAVERVSSEVAEAGARSAAAGELREAQRRLDGGAESEGEGSGEGQGSSDGQGSGEGEGSGQGEGAGEGSGSGEGQGTGSGGSGGGQGQGGQSGGGSGDGSGSGQVPSGSGDDDLFADPLRSRIFDPVDFLPRDEARVPIEGRDPGDFLGTASGSGIDNSAVVPYSERFSQYRQTALDSLENVNVPSSFEAIVRDYFTRLEP